MNIKKCEHRDRKRNKKKYGPLRDGDSVKTIERLQKKRRDNLLNKKRITKEKVLEELLNDELQKPG